LTGPGAAARIGGFFASATAAMTIQIHPFVPADHAEAFALWQRTEGMGLNESDEAHAVHAFLARNPGFSAVARTAEGRMIGSVLCGHDGRRGSLHHLSVEREWRGSGIGRRLAEHCLDRLAAAGIVKCNIFVLRENEGGTAFWLSQGWYETPWLNLQKKLAD
jgi:ribosomal protein S18 acetylase RimI-like enzyme